MKVVVVFACFFDAHIDIVDLNDAVQEVAGEHGGKCPFIQETLAVLEGGVDDQICVTVASRELSESELEMIREDFCKNRYHKRLDTDAVRDVFCVELPDVPSNAQPG